MTAAKVVFWAYLSMITAVLFVAFWIGLAGR
jgi:hypothetical protein